MGYSSILGGISGAGHMEGFFSGISGEGDIEVFLSRISGKVHIGLLAGISWKSI